MGFRATTDHASAVEECEIFAEMNYGVDHEVMRTVLVCLMPSGRVLAAPPCWLIVDSPKHVFWDHLSYAMERLGLERVWQIPYLRTVRPRNANNILDHHLSLRAMPRIYHEYVFDEPPAYPIHRKNHWAEAEGECMRVRARLSWMKTPENGAEDKLYRLIRGAVNPEFRPCLPLPIAKPPEMLLHCLELLRICNPGLSNPPALIKNALMLPSAHAVLMGREKIERRDHEFLFRMLISTIRPWTRRILEAFEEAESYLTLLDLRCRTNLRHELIVKECGRLAWEGVIDWPKPNRQGNRKKFLGWQYKPDATGAAYGVDMAEFIGGRVRWWDG